MPPNRLASCTGTPLAAASSLASCSDARQRGSEPPNPYSYEKSPQVLAMTVTMGVIDGELLAVRSTSRSLRARPRSPTVQTKWNSSKVAAMEVRSALRSFSSTPVRRLSQYSRAGSSGRATIRHRNAPSATCVSISFGIATDFGGGQRESSSTNHSANGRISSNAIQYA
jgi:hypothetical protein